jgi:hypothetical protein
MAESVDATRVEDPCDDRPADWIWCQSVLFVLGSDGTPENPGHVGIYVGEGLLLESPQAGESVHLIRMTVNWMTDLVVRRVVAAG